MAKSSAERVRAYRARKRAKELQQKMLEMANLQGFQDGIAQHDELQTNSQAGGIPKIANSSGIEEIPKCSTEILQGASSEHCKGSWNKLRNSYTNAVNRRKLKTGESAKRMHKWTYEDEMSFLSSSSAPKQSRRNSIEIGPEEQHDDNLVTPSYYARRPSETTSTTRDNSNFNTILDNQFDETIGSPDFNQLEPPTGEKEPLSSVFTTQGQALEYKMNELVSVMKNNSRMLLRQFKNQNQTAGISGYARNCSHDEDELYFLSLAKFVKKLNPAERIRVKAEVSQIIFQAEYRSFQTTAMVQEQQQMQQCPSIFLNSSTTPEQYFSETTITHTKIERE